MTNIKFLNPTINDMEAMRDIWHCTFDSRDAELFFEILYNQELTLVAKFHDKTVAMGYLFPVGELIISEGIAIPTAVIYAVATLPEYQKLGLGGTISNNLIYLARDAGYPGVVLWPAQDSLFNFYSSRTDMKEWFYTYEYKLAAPITTYGNMALTEISPNEYMSLRDELLFAIPHIKFNQNALEYQKGLCKLFGGGLFKIKSPDGDSCAVIEQQDDGSVYIKELVMPSSVTSPGKCIRNIVACINRAYPASEFIVRTPVTKKEARMPMTNIHFQSKRCAMLSLPIKMQNAPKNTVFQPWYGLAFD